MGVRSWSRRFIETWTQPIDGQRDAQRLDRRQPAITLPDGGAILRASARSLDLELDVPRDEEGPGADDRRAGRRMRPARPEVRGAIVGRQRRRQTLESRPPDVRQDTPVGSGRGARIQEDRQLVAIGQPGTELAGEVDAGVHGRLAERHEGHDVQRTDAGMLAVLCAHVDARDRLRREALRRRHHVVRCARERQHAPVVVGIRRPVQERDTPAIGRDGLGIGVDDLDAATLTDVRDAFHARLHGRSLVIGGRRMPRRRAA